VCSDLFGVFSVDWGGLEDSLPQFIMPGSAELSLTQPGGYTIFYEKTSVVGNRVFSTGESVPGIECTATSIATGGKLKLSRPGMSETYTLGGRSGTSVFQFEEDQPDKVELACEYPDGARAPEIVFAVGHEFAIGLFKTIGLSLVSLFGGVGLGVLILVITLIRRRESALRLKQNSVPEAPQD
jgi:hypothetical protein